MSSKYAALPDLDPSQDIYETPDLADDVSTLPTSVSAAPHSVDDDSTSDYSRDSSGIDHARLRPDDARGRFKHTRVDARGVDFSDRISGKRKSYRASSRRRRRRAGAAYGELEEDEEEYDSDDLYGEETLERRLARLKREVEEVRSEIAAREDVDVEDDKDGDREKGGEGEDGEDGEEGEEGEDEVSRVPEGDKLLRLGIDDLSDALEGLQTVSAEERGAQAKLARKLAASLSVPRTLPSPAVDGAVTAAAEAGTTALTTSYTVTYSPAFKKSHALAKAADFDTRLTVLEKVLGMSASALSKADRALPSSAMIASLDELSRQMSVLTNSSTSSLDAASRRVKQLTQEAEKLAEARKAAKTAADAMREDLKLADPTVPAPVPAISPAGSERDAKVNALYGALPTIENLSPLLPALLDRLRSLRAVHADAARAVESLAKVERRQEEMGGEIERWREALGKVEEVVAESEGRVNGNMETVEGWVRVLEEKCRAVEGKGAA